MNKKAIQLSVNFLVIIIISLAVFGMGIIFANKIFSSAGKKVAEMDAQTKEELARLLDQGDKVAMPFFQKSVIHGKTTSFGVGVLNTITSSTFDKEFKIVVEFNEAYKKDDTDICKRSDPTFPTSCGGGGNPDDWLIYDINEHIIETNEQGAFTIAINPLKDTISGIYIFNVAVCYDVAPIGADPYPTASSICPSSHEHGYYHLQKIWLTVK